MPGESCNARRNSTDSGISQNLLVLRPSVFATINFVWMTKTTKLPIDTMIHC